MKTVKFKNKYTNLNELKQYELKSSYKKSDNVLSVILKTDVSELKVDINPKAEVLSKDMFNELRNSFRGYLYDFLKSSSEFLDLDEAIRLCLVCNNLI